MCFPTMAGFNARTFHVSRDKQIALVVAPLSISSPEGNVSSDLVAVPQSRYRRN
jgi:hypothetical protein